MVSEDRQYCEHHAHDNADDLVKCTHARILDAARLQYDSQFRIQRMVDLEGDWQAHSGVDTDDDWIDDVFLFIVGALLTLLLVAGMWAISHHWLMSRSGAVPLSSGVNKLPAHAQSTVAAVTTPYCTQPEGNSNMMPNLAPSTVFSLINSHRGGVALRTDFGQWVNVAIGEAASAINASDSRAKFCVTGVGTSGVMFIEKMP